MNLFFTLLPAGRSSPGGGGERDALCFSFLWTTGTWRGLRRCSQSEPCMLRSGCRANLRLTASDLPLCGTDGIVPPAFRRRPGSSTAEMFSSHARVKRSVVYEIRGREATRAVVEVEGGCALKCSGTFCNTASTCRAIILWCDLPSSCRGDGGGGGAGWMEDCG